MKPPGWLKRTLWAALIVVVLVAGLTGAGWLYLHPSVHRTNGIPYGKRGERTLSLDVLRPKSPNGLGVLVMVSGGWKSKPPGEFPEWMAAPLLRRGYTIFAVCHVSQPRATVMEIIEDMHRAVRFVRHHAGEHGVDPARLGVTGGSAGGHLSLMLATRGGPGPPDAADPVDRESSAVQATALFFPITDLLNLGQSTENPGDGGPPKSYVKAFGPQSTNLAAWKIIGRDTSPIYHISSNLPPVLIHHGDADTLTPLEQSEWFQSAARKAGREVKLVVHSGGATAGGRCRWISGSSPDGSINTFADSSCADLEWANRPASGLKLRQWIFFREPRGHPVPPNTGASIVYQSDRHEQFPATAYRRRMAEGRDLSGPAPDSEGEAANTSEAAFEPRILAPGSRRRDEPEVCRDNDSGKPQ